MTLPATKAQLIASEYLPRLAANESMDDLTARRAIREAEAAVGQSSLEERALLFQVIGIASVRLQKHAQAVRAFRNAIHYAPHAPEHHTNLAACLSEMGRFTEAWSAIADLRADDRHASFVVDLNRADVLLGLGDRKEAVRSLRRASERLDPTNVEEAFMLAAQHAALGLEDDAVEWLGRAAALARGVSPNDASALELTERAPESFLRRVQELPSLARALAAVRAAHDEPVAMSIPRLTAAQLSHLGRLVDQPPEPTDTLRALVGARRD